MIFTREQVAVEARSWIPTPYHRRAAIKHVGVDCGMLPYAVYRAFELIPAFTPKHLSDDWFCHTTQQEYRQMVMQHMRRLPCCCGQVRRSTQAPVAALALVKVVGSERFNHSGVVTSWPMVVHATYDGVYEVDVTQDPMWACKPLEIYDPFPVVEEE